MAKSFVSDEEFQKLISEAQAKNAVPTIKSYAGGIRFANNGSMTTVTITDQKDFEAFKELVQRGSNLWPDAPPQIKEFADLVTNGKVMQDYFAQACVVNLNNPNPLEK